MAIKTGMAAGKTLAIMLLLIMSLLATACGGAAATATPTARIGDITMAKSVDNNNAPQNATTTFNSADTIYATVKVDFFGNGHKVFSRWTVPNQPNEDTGEITADKDYSNVYLEFHIGGNNGQALATGQYTVQLFIDGNAGPKTQFTVNQ